jgi:plastocyanin
MKTSKITSYISMAAVLLLISVSCSKSKDNEDTNPTNDTPGTNEVFIRGMAFVPNTITVAAGTTITWTNKDAITHDVTSGTGLFTSGPLANGATFSFTFATAGNYSYYCSIHPTMVGTVTVN